MRIKAITVVVGAFFLLSLLLHLIIRLKYPFNTHLILDFENSKYLQVKNHLERRIDELTRKVARVSRNKTQEQYNYKPPSVFHKFMLVSDISFDKFYTFPDNITNDYNFVFGIPTRKRSKEQEYLSQTISSLLKDFTAIRELKILMLIYVTDLDNNHCSGVTHLIRTKFDQYLSAGAIQIICPHPEIYPSLDQVPLSIGDPIDRVKWRSKQTLDFALLMAYASTKAEYYLQLEDDVKASDGYAYLIADHVKSVESDKWFLIHFSSLGFIGKLMRCDDLISFSQYLLLYYANQPCDWLMYDYGKGLVCYSGMSPEECNAVLDEIYPHYSPSLFQHMGTISSLNGNINKLKDPLFENIPGVSPKYFNPPAKVQSNFTIYNQNSAHRLYSGTGVLWAKSIKQGDGITVDFLDPQELKGLWVRTGNEMHPQDLLEHGRVEYRVEGGFNFEHCCDFKEGEVHCSLPTSVRVSALRVSVTQPQTPWLIISHFACLLQNNASQTSTLSTL